MSEFVNEQKNTKVIASQYINNNSLNTNNGAPSEDRPIFDATSSGCTSSGIIDILDDPDVAVWSKGITHNVVVPSDRIQEKSKNESMIPAHTEYLDKENASVTKGHLTEEVAVDPANKKDIARVVKLGAALTDQAGYVQIKKNDNKNEQ